MYKYLRGWRKATWAVVAWLLVALGLIGYSFFRLFVAPNGCPDEGVVSFCRFALMTRAFSDFTTAIVVYCAGAVVLGGLWLVTIPNHQPCPECGSSSRTEGGVCKNCGHDFFPSSLAEDHNPDGH